MTLARMLLATAFVASAPVWVGCDGDDPTEPVTEPVRVRITGSWTGTIQPPPPNPTCPLDQTITEDNNGNVRGTADLQAPCALITFGVTGTNNTGGVSDSVELTLTDPAGVLIFNGNFDGVDAMSGFTTGEGCIVTICPTSFTR